MKISVRGSHTYTEVTVVAENVKIEETVSHTVYGKKEDGKTDYGKYLGTDIDDEAMNQFSTVLNDIAYYRESPYDSSSVIKTLFEKLPDDVRKNLLKELNDEYQEEE